jgi:diadenosine tetraphosphate (Ap4A) HIT family hydrolase
MNHYRRTIRKYKSRQKSKGCPFCSLQTISNAVYENELIYIVPNLTQYDLWELHDVQDHLLIIPKRHIKTINELTNKERLAVMEQVAEYEAKGYNIYARGVGFVKRSVEHQHTHLIKTINKKPRLAIFLQYPYYLLKK